MSGKYRRLSCASLLLALMLFSCSREPIRIGMTLVLSGKSSALGTAVRDGALLALDDLEKRGIKTELVMRDDKADLAEGTRQVKLLAGEGIGLVLGHLTSVAVTASLRSANELGILMLSPTANAPTLFGIDDSLFLLMPPADFLAASLADYAYEKRSCRRVALIGDMGNARFTGSYTNGFGDQFVQSGGTVVFDGSLPELSTRKEGLFIELTKKIMAAKPDCVVMATVVRDTSIIAQQLVAAGFMGTLIGSEGSMDASLAADGGKAVQGMIFASLFDKKTPSKRLRTFLADFSHKYGSEPSDISILGYEAFTILAEAAQTSQKPAAVRAKLLSGTFTIFDEGIHFNATGEAKRTVNLLELQGAAFIPVQ